MSASVAEVVLELQVGQREIVVDTFVELRDLLALAGIHTAARVVVNGLPRML